jgi:phosphomevalonate kinase
MIIILIRGFSHSGKDFVGNILCKKYGYMRFAFADSLKKLVAYKYNCDLNILHSQKGKLETCFTDNLKRTYRQILIDEAREMRQVNPDVFVKHSCEEIKQLSSASKIVITDWRYENEISVLHDMFPNDNIYTIHIIRKEQTESPVNDISEYQLMNYKCDYLIYNNMDNSIYNEIDKIEIITNN